MLPKGSVWGGGVCEGVAGTSVMASGVWRREKAVVGGGDGGGGLEEGLSFILFITTINILVVETVPKVSKGVTGVTREQRRRATIAT